MLKKTQPDSFLHCFLIAIKNEVNGQKKNSKSLPTFYRGSSVIPKTRHKNTNRSPNSKTAPMIHLWWCVQGRTISSVRPGGNRTAAGWATFSSPAVKWPAPPDTWTSAASAWSRGEFVVLKTGDLWCWSSERMQGDGRSEGREDG